MAKVVELVAPLLRDGKEPASVQYPGPQGRSRQRSQARRALERCLHGCGLRRLYKWANES